MTNPFKTEKNKIFLTAYAMEIYLPYDYLTSGYRATPCYSLIGEKVRFYGVGNFRVFSSASEMDQPLKVNCYPLVVPTMLTSEPFEIDTREVQFIPNGIVRKCIVLTYHKDDIVVSNTTCIKSLNNVMITLARLDGGKLDNIPPELAISAVTEAERLNGVNLKMPSEETEMYISERYRNPNNRNQKYRFSEKQNNDKVVSYNMREEAMQTTTYQAITHEDINNSLITSINRKKSGIIDDPTPMERVVRGLDLSELQK